MQSAGRRGARALATCGARQAAAVSRDHAIPADAQDNPLWNPQEPSDS